MKTGKTNIFLYTIGFLVFLMPFLGFPSRIENWIISILGLLIIFILIRENYFNNSNQKEIKEKDFSEKKEDVFVESKKIEEDFIEIQNDNFDNKEVVEEIVEEVVLESKESSEKKIPTAREVLANLMKAKKDDENKKEE